MHMYLSSLCHALFSLIVPLSTALSSLLSCHPRSSSFSSIVVPIVYEKEERAEPSWKITVVL